MIDLIFSIVASSLIFVLFKSFPKWNVDTFQAVLSNYFVAALCGILLFHQEIPVKIDYTSVLLSGFACGILFISLFVLMGTSSQKNGISTTSISVKMSMALSVIAVLLISGATIGIFGTIALAFSLVGVFTVSVTKGNQEQKKHLWMLIVLFFGSAVLDVVLYLIQAKFLVGYHMGLFSSVGFLFAGFFGGSFLSYQVLKGKKKFNLRSWGAGILLGVPNYFSIFLLVKSYESSGWEPSKVLAIANVGVVTLSSLLGFLLLKETFSTQKIIGLVLCLLSLTLSFLYL